MTGPARLHALFAPRSALVSLPASGVPAAVRGREMLREGLRARLLAGPRGLAPVDAAAGPDVVAVDAVVIVGEPA